MIKLLMKKFNILILMTLLCLFACKNEQIDTAHNAKNSLSWAGTYQGYLDKDLSTIKIKRDNTYQIVRNNGDKSEGSFVWSEDENKISLSKDKLHFFVSENKLGQIKRVKSRQSFPKKNIAPKIDLSFMTSKWKLIELYENSIPEDIEEPYINFVEYERQVFGKTGCNSFMGNFILLEDNGLKFDMIAATKKYCFEAMEVEDNFLKLLGETVSVKIVNRQLYFLDEENTIIAKFAK